MASWELKCVSSNAICLHLTGMESIDVLRQVRLNLATFPRCGRVGIEDSMYNLVGTKRRWIET